VIVALTFLSWALLVLLRYSKSIKKFMYLLNYAILQTLTLKHTYIHIAHALSLRHSSETPTFYENYLAMSNTPDVTGGKPIVV
jgi:hypothetical protein